MNSQNIFNKKNLIYRFRLSGIKTIFFPIIFILVIVLLLIKIPFANIISPTIVSDIQTLESDDGGYYKLSTSSWLYSGYNNYKDGHIKEYIFYNIVDNKCYYLFASPNFVDEKTFTLNTSYINVSTNKRTDSLNTFLQEFAKDINWNFKSLSENSSSIVLNSTSHSAIFYKILLAVLLIALAYLLVFKLCIVLTIVFPILSPHFSRKHRHTPSGIKSRKEFMMLLQSELENAVYEENNLYITRNYIINLNAGQLCIVPLTQLCFMFEHGNLHKFLWFYMKVTHTIYFLCKNSLKCHFTVKTSSNIDQFMEQIKISIPDLMVGYSSENQTKYMEIVKNNKQLH